MDDPKPWDLLPIRPATFVTPPSDPTTNKRSPNCSRTSSRAVNSTSALVTRVTTAPYSCSKFSSRNDLPSTDRFVTYKRSVVSSLGTVFRSIVLFRPITLSNSKSFVFGPTRRTRSPRRITESSAGTLTQPSLYNLENTIPDSKANGTSRNPRPSTLEFVTSRSTWSGVRSS
jgi:hypothetical protein